MEYKCASCGRIHEEWPAIVFSAPYHYEILSNTEKENIGELTSDFCTIKYEQQTDRFIRVVLNQKIVAHKEVLQYGVWVSVSEKSFNEYRNNFMPTKYETGFFGYLMNRIPEYEETLLTKTDVIVSIGTNRPEIFPHQSQIIENNFVYDYYHGISIKEAEKRVQKIIGYK